MENILRLNQEDIKQILAERYNVANEDISIKITEECYGYGIGEHYEEVVNAEVKLDCSHKEESQKPKRTLEELGITEDKYYIAGRKSH